MTRPERVRRAAQPRRETAAFQSDGRSDQAIFWIRNGAKSALCSRPDCSAMRVNPLLRPEKWKKQASVKTRMARTFEEAPERPIVRMIP